MKFPTRSATLSEKKIKNKLQPYDLSHTRARLRTDYQSNLRVICLCSCI